MSKGRRRPPAAAALFELHAQTICVWRFEDAPLRHKRLARFEPDDYAWVVFIPAVFRELYLPWLDHIDYDQRPEIHHTVDGVVCFGGKGR